MERDAEFSTFVGRRPRLLLRAVDRHEVDERREVGGFEQPHRIDVLVADPQPEVHHRTVVIGSGTAGSADDVAACDGRAFAHRDGLQERVRGAESAGVDDGDVE